MSAELTKGNEPLYELIFEGPVDESLKTLQRVKGVFVADLEFPVADVQRFLTEAPITIKTAAAEDDLKATFAKLKAAGAKVLLIKRGEEAVPKERAPAATKPNEEFTFEFELDEAKPAAIEQPSEPKVYSLDLDENSNPLSEVEALLTHSEEESDPSSEGRTIAITEEDLPTAEEMGEEGLSILSDDELEKFHKQRGGVSAPPEAEAVPKDSPSDDELESFIGSLDLEPVDEEEKAPEPAPEESLELAPLSLAEEEPSGQISNEPPREPVAKASPVEEQAKPKVAPASTSPRLEVTSQSASFALAEEEAAPAMTASSATATPAPSSEPTRPAEDKSVAVEKILAPSQRAPVEKAASSAVDDEGIDVRDLEDDIDSTVVTSTPPAPFTKRKKSKIPFDILVPILVGSLVLGAANWFYFGPRLRDDSRGAAAKTSLGIETAKGSSSSTTAAPIIKFSGEETTSERTTMVNVDFQGDAPSEVSFTITTPQQRARTKEEIVQGIFLPPWLRRIEAQNVRLAQSTSEPGVFEAKAPFLAYLEYRGNPLRTTGILSLRLTRAEGNDWNVLFEAKSSGYVPPADSTLSVTILDEGRPALFVKGASIVRSLSALPTETGTP